MVGNLARNLVESDPEAAVAWAVSLSNEKGRTNQVEKLARQWLRNDSVAVKAWIAGTDQISAEHPPKIGDGRSGELSQKTEQMRASLADTTFISG